MRRILTARPTISGVPQSVTVDGRTYPLSWHDEFDGSGFDPALWVITENGVTAYPGGGAVYNPAINPPYVSGGLAHFPVKLQNGTWHFSGIQGFNEVTAEPRSRVNLDSYVEVRAKCGYGPYVSLDNPNKTGIWSGIWQMPLQKQPGWNGTDPTLTDYYWTPDGVNYQWWPYCGEIDLTEHHWEGPGRHMSGATYIHAVNYAHDGRNMGDMDQAPKIVFSDRFGLASWDDWHTYALHRYTDGGTVRMKIYYDGILVNHAVGGNFTGDNVWDTTYGDFNFEAQYHRVAHSPGNVWGDGPPGSPFNRPFHILLHGCAGAIWNEMVNINPANSGYEPMLVDYVRVYQV